MNHYNPATLAIDRSDKGNALWNLQDGIGRVQDATDECRIANSEDRSLVSGRVVESSPRTNYPSPHPFDLLNSAFAIQHSGISMGSEPTVYVVDDDAEVCHSLRRIIESAGYRVTTYASAREFLRGHNPKTPGCLVLDVSRPAYSGLNLRQQFVADDINLPVIIITDYGDLSAAVRSTRAGSSGFVEKPFNDQSLLDRVRRAVEWDMRNRVERAERVEIVARLALLTPREREVLDRVVSGQTSKQIARDLGVGVKTIEAHRAHVKEKMRADSLAGLIQLVQTAAVNRQPGLMPGPKP